MKEQLATLAECRELKDQYAAAVALLEEEIAASHLGQRVTRAREELLIARDHVAIAEGDVRLLALQHYDKTGNKVPHPDAKVALAKVLDYELVEAFAYARDHLPQALKLNKATFEKAAKVLELDFVAITLEPRVRISRDLSAHLSQGGRP